MNILFTVCGRAGSKGYKNKNLKILKNEPLINHTFRVIAEYINKHPEANVTVALNTDSEELINQAKKQSYIGNFQIIKRKEELAGDVISKVDVIQDTYIECKKIGQYDAVVDLDLTSPMRRVADVENAINKLISDQDFEVVFSVVPSRRSPYFNMVELRENSKFYKQICESNFTARQQAPKTYEMNASIYVYSPTVLENKMDKTLLDYNCGIVEMEDYLVLDIDSEEDFKMMEILWKYFFENINA